MLLLRITRLKNLGFIKPGYRKPAIAALFAFIIVFFLPPYDSSIKALTLNLIVILFVFLVVLSIEKGRKTTIDKIDK